MRPAKRSATLALLGLSTLAAAFLMILVSQDMRDFAPVPLPAESVYAAMVVQGLLAAIAGGSLAAVVKWVLLANAASLSLFVTGIALAMKLSGLPLEVDFVVGWTIRPLLIYGTAAVLFCGLGVLIGMFVHSE